MPEFEGPVRMKSGKYVGRPLPRARYGPCFSCARSVGVAAFPHELKEREENMTLPQDISPANNEIMDTLAKSSNMKWIETEPGAAMKVLWVGPETGRWAVLLKWKKGYVAGPHKHLSAAHAYVLSGKLQVRDTIVEEGDYLYEPNGMVHGATTALEDTVYLFICDGPLLFFDDEKFSGYLGWEQLQRLQQKSSARAAAE